MSLINDALKRAKDAQQKSQPSAPGPLLRPVEPAAAPVASGMGIILPVVGVVIVALGLFFFWQNRQKTAARESVVEKKTPVTIDPVPEPKPVVQPVAVPAPTPVVAVAAAPTPVAPVASAPAPELKLQAIFFAPGRSTAIISGKTVRVGNTLKGFRVAEITQASATLVSATQTNVMTLEQ
jgi:hypothetical protein